jgi:Zn-dependent peptidase ImmA (M78 family)
MFYPMVSTSNGGGGMSHQLEGRSVAWIRDKARTDAEKILNASWTSGTLPVDPITIARSLGVSVFSSELGEDIWGMLVGSESGADIYLDRDQSTKRYRFSCAHEIGHFIDRADELREGGSILDYRSDDSRGRADEIYANEFAGALLMPEKEFLRAIVEGLEDLDLVEMFDVSLDAVKYRRQLLRLSS